jgi:hypothetical protein
MPLKAGHFSVENPGQVSAEINTKVAFFGQRSPAEVAGNHTSDVSSRSKCGPPLTKPI